MLGIVLGGGLLAARPVDAAATCFGLAATIADQKGAIVGTNGDDVIIGDSGDNTIVGKGGNDLICGRGGADVVHGGGGDDRISGGNGDDELHGETDNDTLYGDKGDEDIYGGGGDDVLVGGDDSIGESLFGGPGTDFCTTDGSGGVLLPCQADRGDRPLWSRG
jgi:Ca2+-binding RTX toxin-like protein